MHVGSDMDESSFPSFPAFLLKFCLPDLPVLPVNKNYVEKYFASG